MIVCESGAPMGRRNPTTLSNVIGAVTGCVSSVNWAPVGLLSRVMVAVLGEMTSRCVEVRPWASRAVSVRA